MSSRPNARALGLGAALLFMGCHASRTSGSSTKHEIQAFRVATAVISEQRVPSVIPLTGTLTANVRADVTANASGRVAKTFVERGQKVQPGTVLAQLDVRAAAASAAEAQAQQESANTQLEAAQVECERQNALAARGVVTKQEHDKQISACKGQIATVTASRARLAAASLVLQNGTIRAPFSGKDVKTGKIVCYPTYCVAGPNPICELDPGACEPRRTPP